MKRFLAIYLGTPGGFEKWQAIPAAERQKRERAGISAWLGWDKEHAASIVDRGGPLGKTKRTDATGVADTRNAMTGYVIIEAPSHQAAAQLFRDHPHFTIFPGDAVEIMECMPIPKM